MRVGNASAEIGFSQLVPDGDGCGEVASAPDQNEDLRNLLRSLEQACTEADRKEAALRACRSSISKQAESEPAAKSQLQSWSEWLEALIERELASGEGPDYGTAAFRRLRPKIVAEWRSRQGSRPTN